MGSSKPRIDGMDLEGIVAALRRARLRAEREALMTGTCLVIVEDGKIVRVPPRNLEAIRAEEAALAEGSALP
jgi:hypothetical protein